MRVTRQIVICVSVFFAFVGWALFFLNKGILWDLALYKDYSDHGLDDLFYKHYVDSGIIEQGYINHFIISNFSNPLVVYKLILVLALAIMAFCIIQMLRQYSPMDRTTKFLTVFLLIAHPVMLVFISGITLGYLISIFFFVLGLYAFFMIRHWAKYVLSPLFFSLSIISFFITPGVYQVFVNYVLYREYTQRRKHSFFNLFILAIPILIAALRYMNFHQSGNYSHEYSDMNMYSLIISYLTILPQSFFPFLENNYVANFIFYILIGWMLYKLVLKKEFLKAVFLVATLALVIVPFVISSSYMDEVIDWDIRYAILMPLVGIFLIHFFIEQKLKKTWLTLLAISYSFFFAWFSVVQFSAYLKQEAFSYHFNKSRIEPGTSLYLNDSTQIGFNKTRFYEWTYVANKNNVGPRFIITEPSMIHNQNPESTISYYYEMAIALPGKAQINSRFNNPLEAIVEYFSSSNTQIFFEKNFSLQIDP